MFKLNRGSHYARELQLARLRGIAVGPSTSHANSASELADVIAKFQKHNPTHTLTAQLATLELELHTQVASFFQAAGYRDASHADDVPGDAVLPPRLAQIDAADVATAAAVETAANEVRRIVHELEALAPSTTSDSPANATICVALCVLGHFVLGNDAMVVALVDRTEFLNSDPFVAAPLNEHHVAVTIMGTALYGMACESSGELDDALFAYEHAVALYERARGHAMSKAARTTPFVDEMERWTETALYRAALLSAHLRPSDDAALRAYEAHESRWPGTFRQPQRNVIRTLLARAAGREPAATQAAAPAAAPVVAGAGAGVGAGVGAGASSAAALDAPGMPETAAGRGAAAAAAAPPAAAPAAAAAAACGARTTTQRRPAVAPAPPTPYATIKASALRLVQQSPGFPRADESNAHAENLAEQLVGSWRAQFGACGATEADDVVALLYGLASITFRSQTIQRLLIHMLVAAEAYAEAHRLVRGYMALVDTAWTTQGVPPQRDTSALRATDGPQEYVDTVLAGAHVAMRYMGEAHTAQEWADHLLMIGTSAKSSQHRFTMDMSRFARVLRCAAEARLASARAAAPPDRSTLLSDARTFFHDSLSLDDEASETHYALACLYATERALDDAMRHARKALELEPAFIDAWHLIVLLLSAKKDFPGARSLAADALAQIEADDHAAADTGDVALSQRTQLLSFDFPPTAFARACAYLQLLVTHNTLMELTTGVQVALNAQRDLFTAYHARVAPLCAPPPATQGDAAASAALQAPVLTCREPAELAKSTIQARSAFRVRLGTQLLQRLWLQSAASFRRADDLEQARCAISEAEHLDARFADVWVQLAQWCLAAGKRPGAAVTCLYKALACDTHHVPASVHLARVLLHPSEQLHMRTSHAETIAAVATLPSESLALSDFALADDVGIASAADAENYARATPSRSLGGHAGDARPDARIEAPSGALADASAPFRWQHDPSLSTTSMAEALLRTVTLYRGFDVPEAWHALGQLAQQTHRPVDVQRRAFLEALRLESSRPIRAWHDALAWPL